MLQSVLKSAINKQKTDTQQFCWLFCFVFFPQNLRLIGEDLKRERNKLVFQGQLLNFLITSFLKFQ